MSSPSSRAATAPVRPVDHDVTLEWPGTTFFHDDCGTCGWPVTNTDGVWTHDAKNPMLWTDKRHAKADA